MKNWKPVIGSLLAILQRHGFDLKYTDNGEASVYLEGLTPRQARQLAKSEICATDESHLNVTKDGKTLWLFVVLGNEPEETVADYTCHPGLDVALDEFSARWEGIPCPREMNRRRTKPHPILDRIFAVASAAVAVSIGLLAILSAPQ